MCPSSAATGAAGRRSRRPGWRPARRARGRPRPSWPEADQPGLVDLVASDLDDVRSGSQGHQQASRRRPRGAGGRRGGRPPRWPRAIGLDARGHTAGQRHARLPAAAHPPAAPGRPRTPRRWPRRRLVDDDRGATAVDGHVRRARLGRRRGPVGSRPSAARASTIQRPACPPAMPVVMTRPPSRAAARAASTPLPPGSVTSSMGRSTSPSRCARRARCGRWPGWA